jgi:predicted nucleotidyltransferase
MREKTTKSGLFGKTRQAVLGLLYGQPDRSYYTNQIVDAVNSGSGTVQRELERLSEAGLVLREVQGRQVYYRANPDNPIFPEIKSIIRKTFGIAEVLRSALQPVADNIRSAFIFGSIARNTDDQASDIDVMVIGNIGFGEIVDLLSPAETQLGREINAVVYPETEFQEKTRRDQYFVKTVMEGDKIFLIGNDDELRKLAR